MALRKAKMMGNCQIIDSIVVAQFGGAFSATSLPVNVHLLLIRLLGEARKGQHLLSPILRQQFPHLPVHISTLEFKIPLIWAPLQLKCLSMLTLTPLPIIFLRLALALLAEIAFACLGASPMMIAAYRLFIRV
jgi:hypothetical protein